MATSEQQPAATTATGQVACSEPAVTVVTRDQRIVVHGKDVLVRTEVGTLTLHREDNGKSSKHAVLSFTYYRLVNDAPRPVMFCFNGGPGSSSLWLHLGMVGPFRVATPDPLLTAPLPPYDIVPSDATLLDVADLVFVDPMGTGISRAAEGVDAKTFYSIAADLDTSCDFVARFVDHYRLWNMPKYLLGESYGGLRVAGMAEKLHDRGLPLSGLVLISPALDYATLDEGAGNPLPPVYLLPSFAATAAFHGLGDAPDLKIVESFALREYLPFLLANDAAPEQRASVLAALEGFIKLSPATLSRQANITVAAFTKELLRASGQTVGRLDARALSIDSMPQTHEASDDPSYSFLHGAFAAAQQLVLREKLGLDVAAPYVSFSMAVNEAWQFTVEKNRSGGFPTMVPTLRRAMLKNPRIKVFAAAGLYDLATPYFSIACSLQQLGHEPQVRAAWQQKTYPAGHMMYTHEASRKALGRDIRAFLFGP